MKSSGNPVGALRRAALQGGSFLLARHALVSGVNFGSQVALAWLILPAQLGVFAYTLVAVTACALVADGGLSPALVRTPDRDVAAAANRVFWWMLGAAGCGLAALWIAAPWWAAAYRLPPEQAALLRVHALVLLALPWRAVAVAQLERRLAFQRVAGLEVAEALASQAAVLALAWRGAGVWALIAGPLVRGSLGAVAAPVLAGWRPGRPRGFGPLWPMLRFGATVQSNNLVNFGRDAVVPLVVGPVAGPDAVGYITWATAIANYPAIMLFTIGRVFYPLFVRAGRRMAELRDAVQFALGASVWGIGLAVVPLFGLAAPLVRLVFSPRWGPAVPLFAFFVPINLALAMTFPATAYMNSRGRPGIRVVFAAAGGVVLWLGTLASVHTFGILGFAGSNVALNLVELGLVARLFRELRGLALPSRPLIASLGCGLLLRLAVGEGAALGWVGLVAWGLAGAAAYLVAAGRPDRGTA